MTHAMLTPEIGQVRAWLDCIGGADMGFYFVYHRGHLAFDRGQMVVGEDNQPKWVPCVEVDDVAKLMWQAHERDEVVLTQKRLGPRDWLYVAERTMRVRRKM